MLSHADGAALERPAPATERGGAPLARLGHRRDPPDVRASALGRHGLTSTAAFYSHRNVCALAALRDAIDGVGEPQMQSKLLFAFTAILTRASKRYQWSRRRPLNAANANYYVAPVFYEVERVRRCSPARFRRPPAPEWIKRTRGAAGGLRQRPRALTCTIEIASADRLPLPDDSVDYVFTGPAVRLQHLRASDMNRSKRPSAGRHHRAARPAAGRRRSGKTPAGRAARHSATRRC